MNAAEERVLEHALGELLGTGDSELAERVLRRVRASRAIPRDPRAASAGPGRRRLWATAAAAVLILGSVVVVRGVREHASRQPTVLATAAEPLDVLSPGELERHPATAFGPGGTLVNGPEAERELTLASGEVLRVGRCSMLTLDGDERSIAITPHVGTVTLRGTAPSTARIHTGSGTLGLRGPGVLRVDRRAEGYDLDHPHLFGRLSERIHMQTSLPLILTVVTVVEGSALLETTAGARRLEAGAVLRQDEPADEPAQGRAEAIRDKLLEEVGTWDVSAVHLSPDGERSDPVPGVEIARAGPGEQWLVTELRLGSGERRTEMLTVVGFDRLHGIYAGTLVDGFGGEPGLLKGIPGPDLDARTLEVFSARGTPGFDARWTTRWQDANTRRTAFEARIDGEWIVVREIVHRRRR